MRKEAVWIIIILAASTLAGLIGIQGAWLRKAIQLNEQEFERHVTKVLSNAFGIEQVFTPPPIPHEHTVPIVFTSQERSALIGHLRQTIDSVFETHAIGDPFELGVSTCCSGAVYLSSRADFNDGLARSKISVPLFTGDDVHSHYLKIYFTSKRQFLLRQLGSELSLTFVLLALFLGCFGYTLMALRRQKKLTVLKNELINNMTHELKTPIASIRLAARMLKKEPAFAPKQHSYISLIDNESCRLENQVDKVLQLALIESGNFQLEQSAVNIHELIQAVVANFSIITEQQQGTVILELEASNPIIKADAVHVTNVLYNLVDNALKYTARAPQIRIRTEDAQDGVRITLSDNGIGIKPEAQRHVFETFYREPTGNLHPVKGFGLGLSYVRHIMEAHKGKVFLDSKAGVGTRFTLCFPVYE